MTNSGFWENSIREKGCPRKLCDSWLESLCDALFLKISQKLEISSAKAAVGQNVYF